MAAENQQQHPEVDPAVRPTSGVDAKAGERPIPAPVEREGTLPTSGPALVAPAPKPRMSWGRRIEKLVLALFCLEVGGFLLVFPWVSQWSDNYFFTAAEHLRPLFLSPYFRGAISGLGALNLYLAVIESIDFLGSFLDT